MIKQTLMLKTNVWRQECAIEKTVYTCLNSSSPHLTKVDTSAEIMHSDVFPWMHCNSISSIFKNTLFLLQDLAPNFDDEQRCQFACLDFSLHICWNIAKWDLGRHNTNSFAQKISSQMPLVLFPAVYMYLFTVVNFTIPFRKRKRVQLPWFIVPQASPQEFLCCGQDWKWLEGLMPVAC